MTPSKTVKKSSSTRPSKQIGQARGVKAWLSVVQAYNLCDQLLTQRLSRANAPVVEHEILIHLLRKPGSTQQQIALGCFATKSGISMLLSKLEASELIYRVADSRDARIKCVHLTKRGEKLAEQSLKIQAEVVNLMASALTDLELELIFKVMNSVSEKLIAAEQAN
jgi:DNA-binding MarR family transcriptional regulator